MERGQINRWISARDLEGQGIRLFCLPHAGAGVAGFYQWKRLLAGRIAVCPVMLPGRENRLGEAALRSVETVVEGLQAFVARELDRPYAIFGHSMGALLAFEWARTIECAGMRRPELLIVSGRNAPDEAAPHLDLHLAEDDVLLRELAARYGGVQTAVLEDGEMRSVFVPILRADMQLVESYRFEAWPALACPVLALAGVLDRSVSDIGLARWSRRTSGATEVRRMQGDHFYTLDAAPGGGRAELLDLLAEKLADRLV